MIQPPLPNPAQLFGGVQHEMLPRASIYPDVDMTLVALIEFHDRAYWCCMCHDLRQVLRGELQTATLAPMTETEFRGGCSDVSTGRPTEGHRQSGDMDATDCP